MLPRVNRSSHRDGEIRTVAASSRELHACAEQYAADGAQAFSRPSMAGTRAGLPATGVVYRGAHARAALATKLSRGGNARLPSVLTSNGDFRGNGDDASALTLLEADWVQPQIGPLSGERALG